MQRLDRRNLLQQLAVGASGVLVWDANRLLAAPAPKIRIGQIGTGHAHAAGKMAAVRKLSTLYDVVGVVEPDDALRQSNAQKSEYKGLKWMTEAELLATPGLQAVAVETRVSELLPTASRCIAAGKHVHLDKPAGESLPAFAKLMENAEQQKVAVQMGYMFRYNPAFQLLFRAVREGWLGEIFEIHGVISKSVDDSARLHLAGYVGGSMFELGCHLIDALVALMGKPQRVTAYARRTRQDMDNLYDNMLAVFEYGKATATIRSALLEIEGFRRRQFVVCGDGGTIEIRPLEPPRLTLTLDQPHGDYSKGTQEVVLPISSGRYDGDLVDFAKIIRGEKKPDFSPQHDLAVQETVLRASNLPVT